jgi:hypothetical protein
MIMIFGLINHDLREETTKILYPRISNPKITTPDQTLEIKLSSESCDGISIELETIDKKSLISLATESKRFNEKICYINSTIPIETNKGLYNLKIKIGDLCKLKSRTLIIEDITDSGATFTFITSFL